MIRKELSEVSFNTWIATIEPLNFESKILTLKVPSEFNKGLLGSRYSVLLECLLKKVSSEDIAIQFVVEQTIDNKKKSYVVSHNILSDACLDTRFTFDNMVTGQFNRFASLSSREIAVNKSERLNPLFIFSEPGLGKTHLLNAIGNDILSRNPEEKVVYFTIDKFTNLLIDSIKKDELIQLKHCFCTFDTILVDDLQFLSGKERTQEEFYLLIKELLRQNKGIVLASTKSPGTLDFFDKNFLSFFDIGLVTDINTPTFDDRVLILIKWLELDNKCLTEDAIHTIANACSNNIRELRTVYHRIINYSELTGKDIHPEMVMETLELLY